ncbi:MAG: UDP-N-acetylmuramoyl-L-alanine--D-glutamate ligase, partial [Lachnospiraceae bacterium]|nr:UDP-N-acetylmuramoyl-L-alanine--D-glutamate ligase [Lachnospiraceae bacterium]
LDMAVLSPGVPTDLPVVDTMRSEGVIILGEIELAYQLAQGRLAAITGTNGKTTTTSLVGEILAAYYDDVKVVGNIGIPYTSVAAETQSGTVTVAEVSSFQLETIHDFAPHVSAILNITPDHLNRHHTMENYIRAKEDITMNQTPEDVCVLNYEDEVLREFGAGLGTKVWYFSSQRPVQEGCYLKDGVIYHVQNEEKTPVIRVEDLNILGVHNYENAMAATLVALAMGVPMEHIRRALMSFQAVEHRIEYVTEKRGIRFYNDSKGTNPDAAIKGIQAMNRPTCLIGGGYDKQSEYDEWIDSFDGKVRKLVLIGETKDKIAACARRHGFTDYVFADSLADAVNICYTYAQPGDAVLLSPACASWDMFASYEQRGCMFKELVSNLKE